MRRTIICSSIAVILAAAGIGLVHSTGAQAWALPDRLTDQEFWKLVTDSSEPGGYFRNSDITNLTSNEMLYQHVLTDLAKRTKPGGVYLGVGPEQNYTYMAALKARMAIIFDIRRGNLDIQLMYKAIFELSKDRAYFISMLFSKPRPAGLTRSSSARQLFGSFAKSQTSVDTVFTKYLKKNGVTVTAFYLSNVEQYLYPAKWDLFCRNVATLPLDSSSTFIRSQSVGGFGFDFVSSLAQITNDIKACTWN